MCGIAAGEIRSTATPQGSQRKTPGNARGYALRKALQPVAFLCFSTENALLYSNYSHKNH
jgi:hypothetical protein